MLFWKKKLQSKEYRDLKQQIELLWIEIDIITQRWKRKVKPKQLDELPDETKGFNDGFDDLRKLNKEQGI